MKKKLALLLAVLILLGSPNISWSTSVALATPYDQLSNPFAQADKIRRDSRLTTSQTRGGEVSRAATARITDIKEESDEAAAVKKDKVEGRTFLVQFRVDASLQNIYDILQTEEYILIGSSENRLIRLTTSDIVTFQKKAAALIDFVESNQVCQVEKVANDVYYSQQWALEAINAAVAWDITTGNPVGSTDTVFVAVIDSGINRYHPDLNDVDTRDGWDYILGKSVSSDSIGHGTNVTGIIAAETNNAEGIAGVCWNMAIIPLKVVYSSGNIFISDVVSAIYDAADLGCKVINLSLVHPGASNVDDTAIQYAYNKGCIVVASAGNSGNSTYNYPASYDHVISVGSINSSDTWSYFSTYNDRVDVCAPGENVITTNDSLFPPYSDYANVSGTSFSAPYVSGVAALAACIRRDLTVDQFLTLLTNTSQDLNAPGYDTKSGYGLINAGQLLIDLRASNIYTVTFNSQGGTTVASKSTQYSTLITAPTAPTLTEYTFVGWYKEAACTTAWNFGTDKVTGNTTLYGKWMINSYTVTFSSQGGSAVAGKTADYNTSITAPTVPTLTGYTFVGWYKEVACINAWNFAVDKVTADTTLYAKWTLGSYTIAFNSQGGSAVEGKTADYNTLITAPTAPTLTEYTFVGWYKEVACTTAWNFGTDKVTGNTTLYGKWTINSYTVTFSSQGGTAVEAKTANFNSIITTPTSPTLAGFVFVGWYTSLSYATPWNFTSNKITTNTTLYAKWLQSAVSGLTAKSATYSSIKLTWDAAGGADYYEICRSTNSTGTYSLIQTSAASLLTYTDTNLTIGTNEYYYKIRAYSIVGVSKMYSEYSAFANDPDSLTVDFVTRFYQLCLGRDPDPAGLKDWDTQLISGNLTGAAAAYGFVFSNEFKARNVSNEDYVTIMYKAFLNRDPDPTGYNTWITFLNNGLSRYYVLAGFVNSLEFISLSLTFGINSGSLILSEMMDLYPNITSFVNRFYQQCLNRNADTTGMNDWVAQLARGTGTGAQIAFGFVFSNEFQNRGLNNDQFVTIMYRAFFNRDPDPIGYNGWVSTLYGGNNRYQILAGFVNSREFVILCQNYMINPGVLR